MNLFFKKLHNYLLLVSMGFFFFLLWLPLYYFSLKPERYKGMMKLRRIWAFLSTLCVGIIFKFEYEEPIDWRKTYVICPNHTSNLDTSMICLLMKNDNYSFMGKAELLDGMITGIFFRTVDIPVKRGNKMSAFRAIRAAEEKLKNGISMIMFPEGGIADDYPPRLQEFKSGAFRLAIEQKVPIIPVSSLNTWKMLWDDGCKYGSRPGICRVFVHKPIETAHLTIKDADALRDEVFNIIKSAF
jgi:1-acyl-sn-glycerol-3-phosphate acyltransferase